MNIINLINNLDNEHLQQIIHLMAYWISEGNTNFQTDTDLAELIHLIVEHIVLPHQSYKTSSAKMAEYKKSISFSNFQRAILIGTLLGDASLRRRDFKYNPSYTFTFSQKYDKWQYIEWLYLVFHQFAKGKPNISHTIGKTSMYRFRLMHHPELEFYWNLFYRKIGDKTIKIVPNDIKNYLSPVSLAVLIQDDGTNHADVTNLIATHGFTEQDNHILANALNEKFDLNFKVRKAGKYHRLYLPARDVNNIRDIIEPYIVPCFQYKLVSEKPYY